MAWTIDKDGGSFTAYQPIPSDHHVSSTSKVSGIECGIVTTAGTFTSTALNCPNNKESYGWFQIALNQVTVKMKKQTNGYIINVIPYISSSFDWSISSKTLTCNVVIGTADAEKSVDNCFGLHCSSGIDTQLVENAGENGFEFDFKWSDENFKKLKSNMTITLTWGPVGATWQDLGITINSVYTKITNITLGKDIAYNTGEKPSNLAVTNNKPRTSPSENNAVSQYTNAINLKWSATADPTCDTVSYRYKKSSADTWGSWHNTAVSANSGTINIDSLSSGTNYNIEVKCSNDEGTSSTVSKTIRTLYDPPTLTVTLTESLLERLKFHVKSNRALSKLTYSRTNTNGSGSTPDGFSSGDSEVDITLYDLNMRCKTQYTIYVIGTSTDTYDRRAMTSAASCRGTTLDSNKLQAVSAIEHDDTNTTGVPIKITVNTAPTGMKLTVTVGKYTKTQTITKGTTSANIPLDWDAIYKEYGKNNSVTAKFSLLTNSTNYIDDTDMIASDKAKYISEQTATITLKGKQKTVHVGVNNTPKRVRVWVGDSSGKAKRAVTWVGTPSGTTNRTI